MKTTMEVAEALGIPVSKVRELREQLTEGEHWLTDPEDARRKLFTFAGTEKLRALLGLPPGPGADLPLAAENAPTGQPGAAVAVLEEVLTVHSRPKMQRDGLLSHFPNKRLIEARRAGGEIVRVRVQASVNFRPTLISGQPMTFRARRAEGLQVWELAHDQRCPRWPGRW